MTFSHRISGVLVAIILSVFVAATGHSTEPRAPRPEAATRATGAAGAMMAWRDLSGEWDIKGRFRMQPDAEWMDFMATASVAPVMNGSGFIEKIENPAGGYYAVRLFGFNEAQGLYEMTSFSTGGRVATLSGSLSERVHEFTFEGQFAGESPVAGVVGLKSIYRFIGEDELHFEEYAITQDGKSYLGAQAIYRRKPAGVFSEHEVFRP